MKSITKILVRKGFTLMETVIAIGVVALLVTGFIAVFAPAVEGIRRSISAEEANRLASTLERELVTLRQPAGATNGFAKAFEWIQDSHNSNNALLIYQYRADPTGTPRADGTQPPYTNASGVPGKDFITVSMVRRAGDPLLTEDFGALEGRALVVKCTQLVFDNNGALIRGEAGVIREPRPNGNAATAETYPEAVLTFAAEFYTLPTRNLSSLTQERFDNMTRPMFTRNLAVRR